MATSDPAAVRPPAGRAILVGADRSGSSVALNLAAFLGLQLRGRGRRVCFVDAYVAESETAKWLGAYTPNVSTLAAAGPVTSQTLVEHMVLRPDLNVDALLGPPSAVGAPDDLGGVYRRAVRVLRERYDYVVVDLAPEDPAQMLTPEDLGVHDHAVVAACGTPAGLAAVADRARKLTAAPGRCGLPASQVGILLMVEPDADPCGPAALATVAPHQVYARLAPLNHWPTSSSSPRLPATRNVPEVDGALAAVMTAVTGEELAAPAVRRGGLAGLLRRFR